MKPQAILIGLLLGARLAFGATTVESPATGLTGANMVGYQAAGAGTVARSVKEKLAEFVSVKDFGAKGDGVTDDTVAIQAAINSLPLNAANAGIQTPEGFANGGAVFLPKGRYKVTATVNLKRGVRLYGEGREASQIVSFTSGTVLSYQDAGRAYPDQIVIEDMSIWQDASVTPTRGAGIEVIDGSAASESVFFRGTNLIVKGTYYGIRLSAGIGSAVRDSMVSNTVSHGIVLAYGRGYTMTTSTTFQNVYSQLSKSGSGFFFDHTSYVDCTACASDSNARYGFELSFANSTRLHGGAEQNTLGGVYLNNTRGASVMVDVVDNAAANSNAVTLDTTFGTVIGGMHHSGGSATGYALNVVHGGGPIVTNGLVASGNWAINFANSTSRLLSIGTNANGFTGGVGNKWAFGGVAPNTSIQLGVTGNADNGVTTGLQVDTAFSSAGASNSAVIAKASTAVSTVTYSVLNGAYIQNAEKGYGSTVNRTNGLFLEDQTKGSIANANLAIATSSPAPGNWNVYSTSSRDNLWYGKQRYLSSTGPIQAFGVGSPEGVVTAPVGSYYGRTDGGAGSSFYVKESGTGNRGWVAK